MISTVAPSVSKYLGANPSHSFSPVPASSSITSSNEVLRFNARKLVSLSNPFMLSRRPAWAASLCFVTCPSMIARFSGMQHQPIKQPQPIQHLPRLQPVIIVHCLLTHVR